MPVYRFVDREVDFGDWVLSKLLRYEVFDVRVVKGETDITIKPEPDWLDVVRLVEFSEDDLVIEVETEFGLVKVVKRGSVIDKNLEVEIHLPDTIKLEDPTKTS